MMKGDAYGLFVILICCFQWTYGRSVCYDPLGCFHSRNGWVDLPETLPDSPESIQTSFTMYTENRTCVVDTIGNSTIDGSVFDPYLETAILLKGDPEYSPDGWALDKLNDLRANESLNVILVDWNVKGANSWYYDTSVANLRVVGPQIGLLLQDLRLVYNISMDTVRIIGDSLQGHVARYSWADILDIGTINGYEPTANTTNTTTEELFDDAIIVDLIHPGSPYGVCYDPVGCFPSRYKGEVLPEAPEYVGTTFKFLSHYGFKEWDNKNGIQGYQEWLYTKDIEQKGHLLSGFTFRKEYATKIVIHGFCEEGVPNGTSTESLVDQIRKHKKYNVIVVDWKGGADSLDYVTSVANTRVVGAEVAFLINKLIQVHGLDPGTVHLIGYSLGAQVAGYAGAKVPGIGRITGLDPAGWWFETAHSFSSLDPTDALYVDVIHTDSSPVYGLGIRRPVGTADYYVNGGMDQPGCPRGNYLVKTMVRAYNALEGFSICSHKRSTELFTESINTFYTHTCDFIGYPCDDVDNLDNCTTCNGGCVRMGFHLDLDNIPTGIYHVSTDAVKPYCYHELDPRCKFWEGFCSI